MVPYLKINNNQPISGTYPIDLKQLDHDFFFHLGEKVSNGMSVTNEANLIKDFLVAHPKEIELILSQWDNLKKLLLGECSQKTMEFILPKEYVRWLRFSDYKPIYDNYYSGVETIPVMIDVKDLYEDVINGTTGLFRTICKKIQEESINSIIIDDCIDIETSTFVQKLKKKYPAVKYLSYSDWKSIQDAEEEKRKRKILEQQKEEDRLRQIAKTKRRAKAEADRLAKEEAERIAKAEEERRKKREENKKRRLYVEFKQDEPLLFGDLYYVTNEKLNGVQVIGHRSKSVSTITIPSSIIYNNEEFSVKCIAQNAFAYCENLRVVTIPNSIEMIGNHAFYKCKELKTINIPQGVQIIGYAAFSWCEELCSITIPNSIMELSEEAFSYCISLKLITYEGSRNGWWSVKKGKDWKKGFVPVKEVICIDGSCSC